MAIPNVPFNQLPKDAQRRVRRENPDAFPLRDNRPGRDVDRFPPEPKRDSPQPAKKPSNEGGGWKEKLFGAKEKIETGAKKGFGKAQEFARNHPINNPPDAHKPANKEPNKTNWPKESRGRVSSRDIYKDGVLQERIHYGGPAKQPKQPKPRRGRREDPLGGIGAGMSFRDMMPGSNQGFGLGGMMPDPYGAPAPSRPRKKKGKSQPRRDEPFDYLDHIHSWKDQF
jgi:hypothetical protein